MFPLFFPSPYYLTVMVFVGLNAILVVSLDLVVGHTNQISLGHAAFYGLGAYTSAILSGKLGLSPWMALPVAIVVAGVIALIIGWASLRLHGYYLAMATLGFGFILHIIFVNYVSLTGGPSGISGIPPFSLFGFTLDTDFRYYYFVWTFLGLVMLLSLNIMGSNVGRAYRAIGTDEIAAESLGINTFLHKVQVFVIAGCLAGMAGSLYAHYITFVSPGGFGFLFSIELVVMVFVGGMKNSWGALLGAAILTILPEFLRAYKDYDIIIFGVILILIVIFLPEGIAGMVKAFLTSKTRILEPQRRLKTN
jgi:branched-chain amino acid transport system permease protein